MGKIVLIFVTLIRVNIVDFVGRLTLKCDRWLRKIITHLVYATWSFVYHFLAICEFTSRNPRIGAKFVLTFVTLTFGLWPWPFAWTSLLSLLLMVMNPENFMMTWCEKHSKRRCDKGIQTDGGSDGTVQRAPWSQLKCLWTISNSWHWCHRFIFLLNVRFCLS